MDITPEIDNEEKLSETNIEENHINLENYNHSILNNENNNRRHKQKCYEYITRSPGSIKKNIRKNLL